MVNRQLRVTGTVCRLLLVWVGLVLGSVVLAGCGTSSYGRLQSSSEVDQIFKNHQLLPDYTYYYSGFQRVPYGIIGIDNNYTLRSSVWKPFELNPTVLKQLSYRMANVFSLDPRGAWILDAEGNRVGIWYSSRNQTKIKIEKDRQIVVVAPEPPDLRGIP